MSADSYISLADAPPVVARITGRPCHRKTPFRWRKEGIAGVTLRTAWAMGRHVTTETWLREFFDAVTAKKNGD